MLFGKLFTNPKMWVNGNADDITMGGVYTCKDVQNVPTGDGALFVFKAENTVKQVFIPVGEEGVVYTRVVGEEWASVTGTNAETEALIQSAIEKANQAQAKADTVDTRLNNIIVESGTSDAEVVAARTDSSGQTFTTLGVRLDTQFGEIKEDLSYIGAYPLTWEQGRFNASGNKISGAGRIRTIDYIAVTAGETFVVSVPDSTLVYFYAWNIDGSFNGYTSLALTNGRTYTVPGGVDKIKLVVGANRDFPEITPDYGVNVAIYRTDSALIKTLSNPLKGYAGAMLTIIDDDCNLRFYTDLYPIVRERNVPVSTAVITGSVGDGTHMTWEQIQECAANGIEVLSHTNNHPLSTDSDFDTITTDEIAKDYLIAKNQLALHGVPTDIMVFSGSTGLHDKFRQACERVYKAGILAGDNVTNYQGTDPYAIKRYRIGNATSYACDLTVLKGLINNLNKYGGWMVWMMHTSGNANQWTPGTGEGTSAYIVGQAIDYAVSLGIPIVTAEYGVRKYLDT